VPNDGFVRARSKDARIDGVCVCVDDAAGDDGGVCVGGDAPIGSCASLDGVGGTTTRFRSAAAKELDDARKMHRASDGRG
jgi:hypothetical protein